MAGQIFHHPIFRLDSNFLNIPQRLTFFKNHPPKGWKTCFKPPIRTWSSTSFKHPPIAFLLGRPDASRLRFLQGQDICLAFSCVFDWNFWEAEQLALQTPLALCHQAFCLVTYSQWNQRRSVAWSSRSKCPARVMCICGAPPASRNFLHIDGQRDRWARGLVPLMHSTCCRESWSWGSQGVALSPQGATSWALLCHSSQFDLGDPSALEKQPLQSPLAQSTHNHQGSTAHSLFSMAWSQVELQQQLHHTSPSHPCHHSKQLSMPPDRNSCRNSVGGVGKTKINQQAGGETGVPKRPEAGNQRPYQACH